MENPTNINTDKFKDMDYETAIGRLQECIDILEKGDRSLEELLEIYKEAFEYHAFCTKYLTDMADKFKDVNDSVSSYIQNRRNM